MVKNFRLGFIIEVSTVPQLGCVRRRCRSAARDLSKEKMIMKEFQYTVKDACGIHARPAGLLVKTVKGFTSSVTLEKDGKSCDMRKLMAQSTPAAFKRFAIATVRGRSLVPAP